jgi:YVTN family beta-propeller protein
LPSIPVGGGNGYVVFTRNGEKAYVTSRSTGTVSVIDVAKRVVETRINAGSGAFGINIAPDDKTVYKINLFYPSVSVIDTKTNSVTVRIDLSPYTTTLGNRGAISPDGRLSLCAGV